MSSTQRNVTGTRQEVLRLPQKKVLFSFISDPPGRTRTWVLTSDLLSPSGDHGLCRLTAFARRSLMDQSKLLKSPLRTHTLITEDQTSNLPERPYDLLRHKLPELPAGPPPTRHPGLLSLQRETSSPSLVVARETSVRSSSGTKTSPEQTHLQGRGAARSPSSRNHQPDPGVWRVSVDFIETNLKC